MPTYEYECKKCGIVEVEQRITEAALTKCPQCKKQPVERLLSAPAFHLKGGGWYKDLYSSAKTQASETKNDSTTGPDKSAPESTATAAPKAEATPAKPAAENKKSKSKKAAAQ